MPDLHTGEEKDTAGVLFPLISYLEDFTLFLVLSEV